MQSKQQDTEPDHLTGSTLYVTGGFLGASIGVPLGGVCGLFLPELYYQLTNPEVLKDGQWGLILLATLPGGLVAGSIAGVVIGLVVAHKIK